MAFQKDDSQHTETLIKTVISCHNKLSMAQSLNPAPDVNATFERLVDVCSQFLDARDVEEVSSHILLTSKMVAVLAKARLGFR